jgi:hypothetical protein
MLVKHPTIDVNLVRISFLIFECIVFIEPLLWNIASLLHRFSSPYGDVGDGHAVIDSSLIDFISQLLMIIT